jgi:hypothetical protein
VLVFVVGISLIESDFAITEDNVPLATVDVSAPPEDKLIDSDNSEDAISVLRNESAVVSVSVVVSRAEVSTESVSPPTANELPEAPSIVAEVNV